MDQAGDRAIDLGNGKFRPALVDITPANIRLDIALRRCLGDVRQPGAFECFLQEPLQSRDIACLRRAHDGSILCHFPSPANARPPKSAQRFWDDDMHQSKGRRVAFSAVRHLDRVQAAKDPCDPRQPLAKCAD
ncbi:hypothetical protein [Mesorhizobium sp. Root695]|uniref:hypothetical protein n=1 Tax=Mesorhizobium sp. Root695 TaxID=1736589 RepID=UPI000B03FC34|nr:hypothetical protein [Mesorhizobium sp. Root695]